MTVLRKFILVLVLFVMATIVGVYDNYIRKPEAGYFTLEPAYVQSEMENTNI